jgi:hypothetical protein
LARLEGHTPASTGGSDLQRRDSLQALQN